MLSLASTRYITTDSKPNKDHQRKFAPSYTLVTGVLQFGMILYRIVGVMVLLSWDENPHGIMERAVRCGLGLG